MSAGFTPGPWKAGLNVIASKVGIYCDRINPSVAEVIIYTDSEDECQANAHLIAAAPAYHTVCGGALHPGEADSCGPLAWLRSAIDTLKEDAVREAGQGDDPDAYWTMVNECEELHRGLTAALKQARGEQ